MHNKEFVFCHIFGWKKDQIFREYLTKKTTKQKRLQKRFFALSLKRKQTLQSSDVLLTLGGGKNWHISRWLSKTLEQNFTKINTLIFNKWNPDFTMWKQTQMWMLRQFQGKAHLVFSMGVCKSWKVRGVASSSYHLRCASPQPHEGSWSRWLEDCSGKCQDKSPSLDNFLSVLPICISAFCVFCKSSLLIIPSMTSPWLYVGRSRK